MFLLFLFLFFKFNLKKELSLEAWVMECMGWKMGVDLVGFVHLTGTGLGRLFYLQQFSHPSVKKTHQTTTKNQTKKPPKHQTASKEPADKALEGIQVTNESEGNLPATS